jgi:tripartite-type tricarboxylate transporter receptor subunit TctC
MVANIGQRQANIIIDNKLAGCDGGRGLVDGARRPRSDVDDLGPVDRHFYGGDFDVANFIHVSIASRNPSVLVVNPDFAARTFKDYVAYAKANPGKLAFATSGAGSSNHLLGVRLEQVIGAALVHVPYRGAGPAMIDTMNGIVPSMFDSLPSAAPHIKAGKVRALAVSGEARNPTFPDVPTMKEQGFPDLISYSWFGISVPAKTPAAIVDRLASEIQAVLKEPAVVKRWEEIGAEGSNMTPAEVGRFVQAEIDKWTPVVKASGAKPE